MHETTESLYNAVAKDFAAFLDIMFTSEITLKAANEEMFPHAVTDRTTSKWDLILWSNLRRIFREHAQGAELADHDCGEVISRLPYYIDYNILSQVYLNLQRWQTIRYAAEDAQKDTDGLTNKWAGKSPSPLDAKAKMFKVAANEVESTFNRDLSQLKALRIISAFQPGKITFRVSPKGSTPALTDSENISMLGVGGDRYLRVPPELNVFYLCWEQAPSMIEEIHGKPNCFRAKHIEGYEFESKSGGDILNQVLYARYLMMVIVHQLQRNCFLLVLPRMTSLMIVTPFAPKQVEGTLAMLPGNPQLVVGSR